MKNQDTKTTAAVNDVPDLLSALDLQAQYGSAIASAIGSGEESLDNPTVRLVHQRELAAREQRKAKNKAEREARKARAGSTDNPQTNISKCRNKLEACGLNMSGQALKSGSCFLALADNASVNVEFTGTQSKLVREVLEAFAPAIYAAGVAKGKADSK
jgi:hypothetical protein